MEAISFTTYVSIFCELRFICSSPEKKLDLNSESSEKKNIGGISLQMIDTNDDGELGVPTGTIVLASVSGKRTANVRTVETNVRTVDASAQLH